MEFDEPVQELEALAKSLAEGNVVLLRDKYDKPHRAREPLTFHSSRLWLFPLGVCPDARHPMQIWRNGMVQLMDHEVRVYVLNKASPTGVLVFNKDTHPSDGVQASYTTIPTKELRDP